MQWLIGLMLVFSVAQAGLLWDLFSKKNEPKHVEEIKQQPVKEVEPLKIVEPSVTGSVSSFAPAVEKAAPAVVEIHTMSKINPYANDPFFDFFFRSFGDQGLQQQANGSGVIVDSSGVVATCAHVVRQATDIHIKLSDGRLYKAHVIESSEEKAEDLVLLQIDDAPKDLPCVEIGDVAEMKVGDVLLAIGNAFGLGVSVTQGIVSASLRAVDERIVLQTDASVNPGNSGGAFVDIRGRLMAIPNAILSKSGASHGVGFGRPATLVRAMLDEYRHKRQKPWFGVKGQVLSAEHLQSLSGDKPTSGCAVTLVHAQSTLAKAGLLAKDIIITWNGKPIPSSAMLRYVERTSRLGDPIQLEIWREGKRVTLSSTVSAAPETQVARYTVSSGLFAGVEVTDVNTLTGAESERIAVQKGVVISKVGQNPMGILQGLTEGDVILALNGTKIQTLDDFKHAIENSPQHGFSMELLRGNNQRIVLQMR